MKNMLSWGSSVEKKWFSWKSRLQEVLAWGYWCQIWSNQVLIHCSDYFFHHCFVCLLGVFNKDITVHDFVFFIILGILCILIFVIRSHFMPLYQSACLRCVHQATIIIFRWLPFFLSHAQKAKLMLNWIKPLHFFSWWSPLTMLVVLLGQYFSAWWGSRLFQTAWTVYNSFSSFKITVFSPIQSSLFFMLVHQF